MDFIAAARSRQRMRRGTGRPSYDIMHQEHPLKVFPRCEPFSRGEDVARFNAVAEYWLKQTGNPPFRAEQFRASVVEVQDALVAVVQSQIVLPPYISPVT